MTRLLNKTDADRIEAISKDVLMAFYHDIEKITPPIDITAILKNNNFLLKQGVFHDKNVIGAYDRGTNTIFVAKSDNYNRKVFTIAHELGHYFLHQDKFVEVFNRNHMTQMSSNSEVNKQEAEANCFAASLLMPEKAFKKYWDLSHDMDKLAIIFGVSTVGVFYRLQHLGLM